ncbi:MAG: ABC transporter permease [Candidatus Natronoplasma sp.]
MKADKRIYALLAIVKNSIKKTVLNRKFLIVILGMIFISSLMGYGATQDIERLETGIDLIDIFVISFFLPIMTMIFGSSLIREEIEDNSMTQILTAPISRVETYLGYYISVVIVSIFAMLLILTAGSLVFFSMTGLDSSALNIYFSMIGLICIGSLVYPTLFLLVSVMIERAIYFGLFYVFIWEGFIGSLPGNVKTLSIRHYLRSIGKELLEYGEISSYRSASGSMLSLMILTVLASVLIIAGALIFREKEFH